MFTPHSFPLHLFPFRKSDWINVTESEDEDEEEEEEEEEDDGDDTVPNIHTLLHIFIDIRPHIFLSIIHSN